MKPASFEYFAPTSLEEALDRISEVGADGGKILAGGQSLIPAMNFRLAQPAYLVDLNRIDDLFYIKSEPAGDVWMGAMTRDATAEFSSEIHRVAPMLQECMPFMAHPQIRNRGTVGGAISHGDPAGQIPVVAVAQNFQLRVQSKSTERWINAEDFYLAMYTNAMEEDEILTEIKIQKLPDFTGTCYQQTARQAGASALVAVAALITLDENEICRNARLAFMAVSDKPVLSQKVAEGLIGEKITDALLSAVVEESVSTELDPGDDMHASPEFRSHLACTLGKAALTRAFARARQQEI